MAKASIFLKRDTHFVPEFLWAVWIYCYILYFRKALYGWLAYVLFVGIIRSVSFIFVSARNSQWLKVTLMLWSHPPIHNELKQYKPQRRRSACTRSRRLCWRLLKKQAGNGRHLKEHFKGLLQLVFISGAGAVTLKWNPSGSPSPGNRIQNFKHFFIVYFFKI
jgi:hypothetical protein